MSPNKCEAVTPNQGPARLIHTRCGPTAGSTGVSAARRAPSASGEDPRFGESFADGKHSIADRYHHHHHHHRHPILELPTLIAMKAPSTALLSAISPLWRTGALPWKARGCLVQQQQQRQQQQKADFSSSQQRLARKNRGGDKKDMRISESAVTITRKTPILTDHQPALIRYHLWHPLTPRPLRFSR